jgi:calcineurin-like phosphoesterase family protein
MSRLFFTADTHFGHANIIDYCNRPFKDKLGMPDVEKMNKALIRNWNERVRADDTVIFLGDFCFKNSPGGKPGEGTQVRAEEFIKKLNGRITFVRGNHDYSNGLGTKIDALIMETGGYKFWCCHDPIHLSTFYRVNLVGHVHDWWKFKNLRKTTVINVGVDVWNYRPVALEEILALIPKIKAGMRDTSRRGRNLAAEG